MVMTYEEQLEKVQLAILKIEEGNQTYSVGNRSFTKADLQTLYDRERYLMRAIERRESGGLQVQVILP